MDDLEGFKTGENVIFSTKGEARKIRRMRIS